MAIQRAGFWFDSQKVPRNAKRSISVLASIHTLWSFEQIWAKIQCKFDPARCHSGINLSTSVHFQIWGRRTIWRFPVCRRSTIQTCHRIDREGVSFCRRWRVFRFVFVSDTARARTPQRIENILIVRHVHGDQFSGSHGDGDRRLLRIRIVFASKYWNLLKKQLFFVQKILIN